MENKKIAISTKNLNKNFYVTEDATNTIKESLFNIFKRKSVVKFEALKNINIDIYEGDRVAFIGSNGSGKTTLSKVLSGIYEPSNGEIKIEGTTMFLSLGIGMNDELTARENIYISASILGLKIKEIDLLFDNIVEFSELGDFINRKVKFFSSGMKARLYYSIAVYAKADVIFLDEIFAVGDFSFAKKSERILEETLLKNRTIVIVSHSFETIRKYAHKVGYLKKGEMVFWGDVETGINMYLNDIGEKSE